MTMNARLMPHSNYLNDQCDTLCEGEVASKSQNMHNLLRFFFFACFIFNQFGTRATVCIIWEQQVVGVGS